MTTQDNALRLRPEVEALIRGIAPRIKWDIHAGRPLVSNIAALYFDGPVLADMLTAYEASGGVVIRR